VPTIVQEYIETKDSHIPISSHSGSIPTIVQEYIETKDSHIPIASHSGSVPTIVPEYIETKDSHISVASHTGSVPTIVPEYIETKDSHIPITSHTGSIPTIVQEYIETKDSHISVTSHTGSAVNLVTNYITSKDSHIPISSHTGSVPTIVQEYIETKDSHIPIASSSGSSITTLLLNNILSHDGQLDIQFGNNDSTGSTTITSVTSLPTNMHIIIANSTSSKPEPTLSVIETKDGDFDLIGNSKLNDVLNKSFVDLTKEWGVGSSDLHFINTETGSEGKYGDYNTYHYEKRYIFSMIGDVETVSGSNPSISSSFETDFTGTLTSGIYTASKHFSNLTFIDSEIGLGRRPLGTTIQFKPTGSIDIRAGKFLDETFVYPANHIYIVGTSRDSIDTLIYKGTQNLGSELLESDAFTDLSTDAFYYVKTTGGSGYTISYET
jgi:hypothetical protein